jgi:hypothetical protein
LGAPTGGHGHADALSIVLFSGGRDLLIDPGTCVYNGAPEWRGYFRSTRAHNTVMVDRRDQSEQSGTFQWKHRAETRGLAGNAHFAAGEHHGYEPVIHKRKVEVCQSGSCVIVDELLGTGMHVFDFLYHFPADVRLHIASQPGAPIEVSAEATGGEALLFFCTKASAEADVIAGWVSPRYGKRESASVLRVRVKATPPLLASTVILPFRKGAPSCAESAEWLSSMPVAP